MKGTFFSRLQANFFAGLAIVLPAVISIAVVVWLFGTVSNITDRLLFAVPREWKYVNGQQGDIFWYWSLVALVLAVLLLAIIGRLTRNYLGKKLIQASDRVMLQVPLLNKVYSTIKQVQEAFAGKQSSFQQAVLVQFPRAGVYSLGFVTGYLHDEVQRKTSQQVWSVFVPTTPNPTTGFLIYAPEEELIRLEMSVADAIKNIISLGSISPEYRVKLAEVQGLMGAVGEGTPTGTVVVASVAVRTATNFEPSVSVAREVSAPAPTTAGEVAGKSGD